MILLQVTGRGKYPAFCVYVANVCSQGVGMTFPAVPDIEESEYKLQELYSDIT